MNPATNAEAHPASKTALIIVDVQYDFCPGGSLATSRGHQVAAAIGELQRTSDYAAIVTTQDWHIDPKGHFSDNPDFVDTWPVHCVADSPGAALHADLDEDRIDERFFKGEYSAAYSGFEGASATGDTLAAWLKDNGIESVDVVGIATDYCVKATAADALREGFTVTLLKDYCSAVVEENSDAVFAELTQAGATVQ